LPERSNILGDAIGFTFHPKRQDHPEVILKTIVMLPWTAAAEDLYIGEVVTAFQSAPAKSLERFSPRLAPSNLRSRKWD
jgi:hypothetical protein